MRVIAFVWSNLGPYHVDRLERLRDAFAGTHRIAGIEIAGATAMYPWSRAAAIDGIEHRTLFPDRSAEGVSRLRVFWSLLRCLLGTGARDIFLCHYQQIETLAAALCLRLLGRRVYLMIDSKFDDRERTLSRELRKIPFFLPYNGALVSGRRAAEYLKFFGFKDDRIQPGYDTISIARLRRLAAAGRSAPIPFEARPFVVVARLVPNKNVAVAIRAYGRYRAAVGASARALHIYGVGPLEAALRELAGPGVAFRGFAQNPELAPALAEAVALVLPSTGEQWGLVVNEALALGIPVLCGDNVGARDSLVRTGVNGYIFEADNEDGLGHLMQLVAGDEAAWKRLSAGADAFAPRGDVAQFCEGVRRIVAPHPRKASAP